MRNVVFLVVVEIHVNNDPVEHRKYRHTVSLELRLGVHATDKKLSLRFSLNNPLLFDA